MRSEAFMNLIIGALLMLVATAILMLYAAPKAFIDVVCSLSNHSSDAPACQLQSTQ